ncbi:SGNH/GDSL hydrolase family protein [Paenibacillus harenae]|uniref:Lysophospholipase L1-like esterase n=1 Tax=Paenibacillus harenae TaxID=306543 RepID=A0ABT9TZ78_PAEHA|nr:SGNH/GDSL hydrolase family protein [Paenibacillus harenae]MDQ0112028.1 lysophospholipase L1-like esterase [Paenibacillus harenae]
MTDTYASVTALSSAANFMFRPTGETIITFRTYVKPREYGALRLKVWHSNAVDSTWSDGTESKAGDEGGAWRIESCTIGDGGRQPDGSAQEGSLRIVTFEGAAFKQVLAGERFWSDPVDAYIPEGHFLVFTWAIAVSGPESGIPYNTETLLAAAYEAAGNIAAQETAEGFLPAGNRQVLPSMIAYERETDKRLVFLGDSITQGVRTEIDGYSFWSARIAEGLAPSIGVWNIGSGWARAYDLAPDGPWMAKAKQGDEVAICLGVNDIGTGNRSAGQLIGDLTSIIEQLEATNEDVSIILFTLPAFNFEGAHEEVWRTVNEWIRKQAPERVARVFDIAKILGQAPPYENKLKDEYMSPGNDPHPNGVAGADVAEAFLLWYNQQ